MTFKLETRPKASESSSRFQGGTRQGHYRDMTGTRHGDYREKKEIRQKQVNKRQESRELGVGGGGWGGKGMVRDR